MYVNLTEAERQEIGRLYELSEKTYNDSEAERYKLMQEYPPPDTDDYYDKISKQENPKAWEKAKADWDAAMDEWANNKPPEWTRAYNAFQDRINKRLDEISAQRASIRNTALERHFKTIEGNPAAILADAKFQAVRRIDLLIDEYQRAENQKGILSFSGEALVPLGNGLWKLNADELTEIINEELRRHYNMLAGEVDLTGESVTDQLNAFIENYLSDNPHVTREPPPKDRTVKVPQDYIRTAYPQRLVSPIDKVSKKLFAGELTTELQPLRMEKRKSKKQITTLASINFSAPQLEGLPSMGFYERAVYNAICALYVAGGNEYITPQMVYQVMTGKEDAYLNPKQAEKISACIKKFMTSMLNIDATQEAKAQDKQFKGSLTYYTNLLQAEGAKRNLNGTITECIRLLKTPILYEYADTKDQIARAPIAALSTPVNKNEDTITLQAYLLDRIFSMRGNDPVRDIAYNTVYGIVWGKGWDKIPASMAPQDRKKAQANRNTQKRRLRGYMDTMLQYWATKEGGNLIKGHSEYIRGKTPQGVTIRT